MPFLLLLRFGLLTCVGNDYLENLHICPCEFKWKEQKELVRCTAPRLVTTAGHYSTLDPFCAFHKRNPTKRDEASRTQKFHLQGLRCKAIDTGHEDPKPVACNGLNAQ